MDFQWWLDHVGNIGGTFCMVVAIVGGYRRWYVWGWQYDAVVAEKDRWIEVALNGLGIAEKLVTRR